MGAIHNYDCPICGRNSGERGRDDSLPCRYCNDNETLGAGIRRSDEESDTRIITYFVIAIICMLFCILIF